MAQLMIQSHDKYTSGKSARRADLCENPGLQVRGNLQMDFSPGRTHCVKSAFVILIALFAAFLPSCGDVAEPTNLEPVIKNLSVSEITRTSAKLTAEIELRGSGSFDSFHFVYYAESGSEFTTENIVNPSGVVEIELTGLIPGTSYSFKGVGIRNTAVLQSKAITFVTDPNECPSISSLSTVSVGPTAIIVKFDVLSDGGDRLTESGCYIGRANDALTLKIKSEDNYFDDSTKYIFVNSLDTLTEYVLYPYAANSVGEIVGEAFHFTTSDAVVLNRAGDLGRILSGASLEDGDLTISGLLNGDDFKYLRSLLSSSVRNLNIADVSIVEGGGSYDGNRFTKKDVISTGLFDDCSSLELVTLPNAATSIERNAFSGCGSLKSLCIPAGASSVLPSADCKSLQHLSVSEANRYFKEYDGVVYDYDLTGLAWYPEAKTGKLTLPSSLSKIGESAFSDSKIEFISLPDAIREIGRCAFEGSMLREITIPDNVRNISEGMLQNCMQLKTVVLGKSVEFVGNYVFDNSPVKDLYLLSPYPPFVSSDTFGNNRSLYENCSLHVPSGCRDTYRNHSVWGLFENIYE
ncbi:MAG: leucine-rich repeat protein [Muribaculum sp.]|nr:leucine-rich repeat protein [Muribaculum sp.]